MARSSFARARAAYELAHLTSSARGVALAATLALVTAVIHAPTHATWLVAGVLAITLAVFGWRGGPLRRGGLLGVLAGTLPLIAPGVVSLATDGIECFGCPSTPSPVGMLVCFAISAVVGATVGYQATRDRAPRPFALAATVTAALTGTLGCGTTGLGGATGIAVALLAGSATGWIASARAT